jgi:hypothetical protein
MKMRIFPRRWLTILILAGSVVAQPIGSQEDRPIVEEWRDVLRYGIDSEVLKVIKSISESEEKSLNQELTALFEKPCSTISQPNRSGMQKPPPSPCWTANRSMTAD